MTKCKEEQGCDAVTPARPAAQCVPNRNAESYYRTAAGTELDLVVELGGKKIAFEVKFSTAPKPTKGFWQGLKDVGAGKAYVMAPVLIGIQA